MTGLVESLAPETVRLRLKKRAQAVVEEIVVHSRGKRRLRGSYGGRAGPRIQYGEGSLHRALRPQRPVVCFDESSTQLLADTRDPVPAGSGSPKRQDYEYRREGTRNLFLACDPQRGWRHVAIT
ncbi:MAG: hypothetical protein OXE17_05585 [Chloroflexi bacterium]|nr:hypothetical protein [Chloroflexota bacterium]